MYTRHICRSEGASSFTSKDKNKLKNVKKLQRMGERDKAAEYSLMRITPF